MTRARTRAAALVALAILGCGDHPVAVSARPRLELQPRSVTFGTPVGATIAVRAVVSGFGPSPQIRWTSLNPSVVVENVREGGTVADLRAVARAQPGGIEVRVTGTSTLADTVAVTVLAAARRP